MKKNIFVAVLLFFTSLSFAQLNWGLKIGYNSSLSFSNINSATNGGYEISNITTDVLNNFQVGTFARINMASIYLQPEILYCMQKNSYSVTTQGSTYNKTVNVKTIEIPLLLGYKLVDLKVFNLRAFAGPKLRLDAGSTINYAYSTTPTENIVSDLKKASVGLETGLGVDVLNVTLDFRYNLINNIYEPKTNDYTLPSSTILFSLGWKFL